MLIDYHLGATSIVVRIKLRNSSVSTGAGLTGLTSASSGLIIAAIADNEATTTAYTAAGSLIDTIATLGVYAAPTATHCRFKEVDATNHKGLYEIQLENSRYAVSSAKSLTISLSGATNLAECDVCIPLRTVDPYNANFGLTGLTGLTAPTAGALPTIGSGTGQINPSGGKVPATLASTDVTGNVAADIQTIKTQTVTCAAGVTVNPFVGTATAALVVNASGFVTLVDGSFTAAKVASAAITSSAFGTDAISSAAFAQAAADKVWASTTRVLTAGTNIVLAKSTGITGFNDITAAAVWDLATSGHTTAGTFGAAVATVTLASTQSFNNTGQTTNLPADLQTIKTQAVTCSAGVTVGPFVGTTNLISTDSNGRIKIQVGTGLGQLNTTSGAVLLAPPDSLAARTGTCQAGSTSTTIVLDSGASSTDDAYRGMLVRLTGGTGSSIYQTRTIVSYTGSTTTATLDRAWKTTPDNTTTFALIYANAPRLDTQLRVDVGSWLDQAVTLDANNLPNVAVKDWNGVAVGALPANFSSLAIDGSGNVSVVFANVWTAAGAPTVNLDGSVHADVVSINEAAVTIDDIIADVGTALTNYGASKTSDLSAIPAAVWDLATSGHTTSGTFGAAVIAAAAPTAAQNAAAVWDLTTSGHTTTGTFGAKLNAAAAGGDPLATDVATGYTGTQAGAILKALDLNGVLTWRDQTSNATPNGHDARFAAWFTAFGQESDPDPTTGQSHALGLDGTTTIFTYDAPTRVQLTGDALDLVMVEPTAGINARQALQQVLASASGTVAITTANNITTVVINGANTAIPRIVATTDAIGDRTQVNNLFDA